MSVSNVKFNHSHLVNIPPQISNVPVYDYMHDNNMFYCPTLLKAAQSDTIDYRTTDKFMTGLYFATIGTIGAGIYTGYRKVKNLFKIR